MKIPEIKWEQLQFCIWGKADNGYEITVRNTFGYWSFTLYFLQVIGEKDQGVFKSSDEAKLAAEIFMLQNIIKNIK